MATRIGDAQPGIDCEVKQIDCQIDDYENQLRVTRHARMWLNKTSEEQIFHLIDSWQDVPINMEVRQALKKLLWKLKCNKSLTAKDLGTINGLKILGLVLGS